MKIRTLLGLAAIGGVAYAHQKRGGEWTIDGLKKTLHELFSGMQDKVRGFAHEAKDEIGEEVENVRQSQSSGYGTGSDLGYTR